MYSVAIQVMPAGYSWIYSTGVAGGPSRKGVWYGEMNH